MLNTLETAGAKLAHTALSLWIAHWLHTVDTAGGGWQWALCDVGTGSYPNTITIANTNTNTNTNTDTNTLDNTWVRADPKHRCLQ